jgi:thymidylate synthase
MGGPEVAARKAEVHHAAPRCLLTLHERANGAELDGEGIQAWVEWEIEAMRWRVPGEIARGDLEALIASSEVVLEKETHRLVHASDWRRWGSRGGRETLRRYGADWFALLALRRWGRLSPEDLEAARVLR